MTHFFPSRLALAAVLLFATATSGGMHASAMQPGRAASTLALDFFAVARDGRPVPDLRAEEVTLKVDGKVRKVQSLQWVSTSDSNPSDASPSLIPLPPPYGTNAPDPSRAIILVVDDDSFRAGREAPLRTAVEKWLNELPLRDRIALVTVPYGGLKVDFTTDRSKINQALSTIIGQAAPDESGSQLACRTRATLESLRGLLESLAGGQGPTPLVFFSSGMAGPRRDAPVALAPGACELTTEHYRQVSVAAAGARAHFYLMQPDDVRLRLGGRPPENIAGGDFIGSDNPMEGLEHLAGVTGGTQLQLTSTRESGLTRVARETAGYYLLSFEPEQSDRNGSAHPIDLRVARTDLTVRSRPSVAIPKASGRPRAPSPRDMLREARAHRDLPLRAIGYASLNTGDSKLKIVTVAEPIDAVKLAGAAAGLFDDKGKLVAQWTANPEELESRPLMAALIAPPGMYRLRVAATDDMGRGGSADYEVDAQLAAAGPLKLSTLVLGLSRGGFRPALQFASEPVAIAYLEMYGQPAAGQPINVTVELATTLDGAPLLSVPGAVAQTSDPTRRIASAAIPIGSLSPGDYVVRAIAGVPGAPAGRVVRTLRKVAR